MPVRNMRWFSGYGEDIVSDEQVIAFVEPHDRTEHGVYNAGFVLRVRGEFVEREIRSQGNCLGDWFIDELTPDGFSGIMVWEGRCENSEQRCGRDPSGESWEPRFAGAWRKPTARELWELSNGQVS